MKPKMNLKLEILKHNKMLPRMTEFMNLHTCLKNVLIPACIVLFCHLWSQRMNLIVIISVLNHSYVHIFVFNEMSQELLDGLL